jgi:hypothetical protein
MSGYYYNSCYNQCYNPCYNPCYNQCYNQCYNPCYNNCYNSCYYYTITATGGGGSIGIANTYTATNNWSGTFSINTSGVISGNITSTQNCNCLNNTITLTSTTDNTTITINNTNITSTLTNSTDIYTASTSFNRCGCRYNATLNYTISHQIEEEDCEA